MMIEPDNCLDTDQEVRNAGESSTRRSHGEDSSGDR